MILTLLSAVSIERNVMIHIPDVAVQAALDKWFNGPGTGIPGVVDDMRKALIAAIPHLTLSPAKPVDQFKAEFKRGYILACCNLINMHGTNTETIDLFQQLGITQDEIAAMDLSEYDLSALTDLETAYGLEKMYGTPAAPTSKGGE